MPAPVLTLDIIEGASLTTRVGGGRHIRCGHIQNIPVSTFNDHSWDLKALATPGMPQMGERHPSGDGTIVVAHMFRGMANDQARVEIVYDTPGGYEIPDGIFIIEDTTTLVSRAALKVPGVPYYVRVEAAPTNEAGTVPAPAGTIGDSQPFNYLCPLRTLTFRAVIDYPPNAYLPALVGTVNKNTWQGLPPGYWLCAEVQAVGIAFDQNSKITRRRMTGAFVTRQREDWTEYQGLRGPDGRVREITAGDLSRLTGVNYQTVRDTTGQMRVKNGTRIAPYDMFDFLAYFGF